jgi:pyruvate/2-oxoglutarate/acetoin dehydrogenase E1 component
MLLALDSIINGAAKIPFMSGGQFKMPLVVRVPGGIARQLAAQHAQRLEHTLMNVPGLRIAVPATPQDAYWQLRQTIRSSSWSTSCFISPRVRWTSSPKRRRCTAPQCVAKAAISPS